MEGGRKLGGGGVGDRNGVETICGESWGERKEWTEMGGGLFKTGFREPMRVTLTETPISGDMEAAVATSCSQAELPTHPRNFQPKNCPVYNKCRIKDRAEAEEMANQL